MVEAGHSNLDKVEEREPRSVERRRLTWRMTNAKEEARRLDSQPRSKFWQRFHVKGLHPMKGINTDSSSRHCPSLFALIPKVEGNTEEDDSSYRKSQKKHSVKRKETGTWKDLERELEDLNEEPNSEENEWSQTESREADRWCQRKNVEDTKAVIQIAISPQLPMLNSSPIDQKKARTMQVQDEICPILQDLAMV